MSIAGESAAAASAGAHRGSRQARPAGPRAGRTKSWSRHWHHPGQWRPGRRAWPPWPHRRGHGWGRSRGASAPRPPRTSPPSSIRLCGRRCSCSTLPPRGPCLSPPAAERDEREDADPVFTASAHHHAVLELPQGHLVEQGLLLSGELVVELGAGPRDLVGQPVWAEIGGKVQPRGKSSR